MPASLNEDSRKTQGIRRDARESQQEVKNRVFLEYMQRYKAIEENFIEQVREFGLPFHTQNDTIIGREGAIWQLKNRGKAVFRNNDKSIYYGCISPACQVCAKGTGSATFYVSLMCHRNCYFCFNPNQEDYEEFSDNKNDWRRQLDGLLESGQQMTHLALSGGEPLLHKEDTLEFFRTVSQRVKGAHTRLYTCGDLLDRELAKKLGETGLQEIRFSIKLEDDQEARALVLDKIALAKEYIPCVMVEMPVIPGTMEEMKDLLLELDKQGVFCINLLEFCFPYHNAQEYAKRGFELKYPPFQILYNYWYSGGLAVDGSEVMCLELIEFAIEQKLSMGVHYCSLENKHTGQIYIQNSSTGNIPKTMIASTKDFFLKTVKVFGQDMEKAACILRSKGVLDFQEEPEYQYLQFSPKYVKYFKGTGIELGLSCNVMEEREGQPVIRELCIDVIRPETFRYKEI